MNDNKDSSQPAAPGGPALMIDLLSQLDIDYWCQIFHVSPAQLREAVGHAGPQAVEVSRYLRGKGYTGAV